MYAANSQMFIELSMCSEDMYATTNQKDTNKEVYMVS